MTATPVPAGSSANGICGSAPGWGACASDPTKCTPQQILHGYQPFGSYLVNSVTFVNSAKSSAAGSGYFLNSCHTHCEAQGGGFDTFAIGGTTMNAAVTAWMAANANPAAPAASKAFSLLDCEYTTTGNHVCNPTC